MRRVLVGYDECRCILTQYCDGECRPVFADRPLRNSVASTTPTAIAQLVGVISVTEEHGWHMDPLVGWETLGYGRRLFAEQTCDVLIPGNPYMAACISMEKP